MPRKTDKRERLIEAATMLLYHQGFNLTTLADIAQAADVPLGNVYYYFKTKEAIGVAVLTQRSQEWKTRITSWNRISDTVTRLYALVNFSLESLDITARYGCPVGGLCQELSKQGGVLADLAAKLLHEILVWSEAQFSTLGAKDKANALALNFVSSVQGMLLLTNTFKDPKLAPTQAAIIRSWLEGVTNCRVNTELLKQEALQSAES
jgi:TetR/AcrR family transcriptional regulator, transcriptional repressor for nem operon